VESPVRGDMHAGFGERSGETGWEQSHYRAPGRLDRRSGGLGVPQSENALAWWENRTSLGFDPVHDEGHLVDAIIPC